MVDGTTPGPWRGYATSWKSIDEMVEEHRRLLLARPDHLITYDILAPDPKDPKGDVVVATMGNGPTAEANGLVLLAAPDLLAACEACVAQMRLDARAADFQSALDGARAAIAKAKGGAR